MGPAPNRTDVVVAGGSIAGLTSCMALKAAYPKLKITLVEPRATNAPSGASIAIGVNGVKALCGFAPEAAKQLIPLDAGITAVKQFDGDGILIRDTSLPRGVIAAQQMQLFGTQTVLAVYHQLSQLLRSHLPPDVTVVRGKVCDVEESSRGVTVRYDSTAGTGQWGADIECGLGESATLKADMLIAADGYRSTVRSLTVPDELSPRYCGNFVIWGRADGGPPPPEISYNVVHVGGAQMLLLPTNPTVCVFFGAAAGLSKFGMRYDIVTNRLESEATGEVVSKVACGEAIAAKQSPEIKQYVAALHDDSMVLRGMLRHTPEQWQRRLYGSGRVVIVGDAAHVMLPDGRAGGQAIEDAYWLGRLAKEGGLDDGLAAALAQQREERIRLCLEMDTDKAAVMERYAETTGEVLSEQDMVVRNPLLFKVGFPPFGEAPVEALV